MAGNGQVVGGQYMNGTVTTNIKGELVLQSGFKRLKLNSDEVAQWDEVDPETRGVAGAVGAVGQAVAGAVLPGFVGKAASAALGATLDATMRPPRRVRIDWVDGNQSLLKLPEKLFTHMTILLGDQRAVVVEAETASIGASSANPPDFVDQIVKLASLRDQGILTESEFTTKKAELLARF